MEDSEIARLIVQAHRGISVREVQRLTGISRTTISNWRKAVKAGSAVEMEEPTRGAAIAFLQAVPAQQSPSYADGARWAIRETGAGVAALLADLRRRLGLPEEGDEGNPLGAYLASRGPDDEEGKDRDVG